ncbi:MAG: hypothetical protein WDM79_18270 [Terricaulis sp.]
MRALAMDAGARIFHVRMMMISPFMTRLAALGALAFAAACQPAAPPASHAESAPSVAATEPEAPLSAVPPPAAPPTQVAGAHVSDALDVTTVRMGPLVVLLDRTLMRDVQSEIGVGVMDEAGDGVDWSSWLCYTIPRSQRVWLTSGQMGAADFVSRIAAVADTSAEPTEHCPALPARFAQISIEPGVWLGMPQSRVQHLFGAATSSDAWDRYANERHWYRDNLQVDESHSLLLKTENGRVVELQAAKLTAS